MKCICCLSNKIILLHSGPAGCYSCERCGLIFRENIEEDDYFGRVKHHYQKTDPHEQVAESKLKFFRSALDYLSSQFEKKCRRILDVGCGYGYFLELAQKRGWQVWGIEIMSGGARVAKKKLGTNSIFNGRLTEACYPRSSFDAITLWDVLFVVDDPFKELKECYRILKNGGAIGIRVRNAFFQKIIYRAHLHSHKIASRLSIKNPAVFHRYCYSSQSIYNLLQRIGFRHIKIINSPLTAGNPYGHASSGLTQAAKRMIYLTSRFIFWMSDGRWVVGPSLLIWAEKPTSNIKP